MLLMGTDIIHDGQSIDRKNGKNGYWNKKGDKARKGWSVSRYQNLATMEDKAMIFFGRVVDRRSKDRLELVVVV